MKTNLSEYSVIRDGIDQENSFSIKATGKAFRILSDGLYTDKILAIVRELSCNAYDAHVAAGNPEEPFLVKLPTTIEPSFTIRDFGVGLSTEDVLHLYTTYFESTKTDSNDFIGALGLGSKSPFCYVDSFLVNSYFNGTKSMFAAFISESGIPSITELNSEPTDERNGLEVIVAVASQNDHYVFAQKAQHVYRTFKTKPTIVGGSVSYTSNDIISGNAWVLKSNKNYIRAIAVQGNVGYPISISAIPDLPNDLRNILEMDIDIHFEIGDLDVTASRESLSMDVRTQKKIIERLQEIRADIISTIENKIASSKTKWEAVTKLNEFLSMNYYFKEIVQAATITYADKPITSAIEINLHKISKDLVCKHYWGHYIKPRDSYGSTSEPILTMRPTKDISIWINDVGSSASSRIEYGRKNSLKDSSNLYLLKLIPPQGVSERKESDIKDLVTRSKALKQLLQQLGNPPVHYVSELPKITTPTSITRKVKVFKFSRQPYLFYKNYKAKYIVSDKPISKFKESWDITELSIDDFVTQKSTYVVIDKFKPTQYSVDDFARLYANSLSAEIPEDFPIYGIRVSDAKKLKLAPENEYREVLKKKVKAAIIKLKLQSKIEAKQELAAISSKMAGFIKLITDFRSNLEQFDNFANFNKLYDKIKTIPKLTEAEDQLYELAQQLGIEIKYNPNTQSISDLFSNMITTYPFLAYINASYDYYTKPKIDIDALVQYINLIDKFGKEQILVQEMENF